MTDELKEILIAYTRRELPDLGPDSVLTADLGLNSLELFDLVCTIEEHFGIEIADTALRKLVTVSDLVFCLEKELQQ